MNKRHELLVLCLLLAISLSSVSCSDEESEKAEATATQAQEETSVADSAPEQEELAAEEDEEGSTETEESGSSVDLAAAYHGECDSGKNRSLDCEVLRSLLVVDVAMALEEIQRSGDQRGTEEALSALDLVDEPEILIAACGVLGYFPDTPGIVEKAVPLMLDSPYLAVAQAAGQLLSRNPDPGVASMAQQWGSNHGVLWTNNEYELAPDFPEHYFDMGFPEYPDAEWFSPADSDRSVGWRVAATPAEVTAWLAEELAVEAMSFDQWSQRSSEEMMKAYQLVTDPAYTEEVQKMMEEYMKTQDPAVMEKIEKKQAEVDAMSKKIESDQAKSLTNVMSPPGGIAMEDLSYFVAEEKDGHISRAILVYRYAGSEQTVMQMAWDLRDYPPAWAAAN